MPRDKSRPSDHKIKEAVGSGWDALDKKDKLRPRSWNIDIPKSSTANLIENAKNSYQDIPIKKIQPDPNQPRRIFNQKSILDLAKSISDPDVGLIEPIVVRPLVPAGTYQLIAGERRWRACQSLNHETIKAIILDVTSEQAYKISVIENINRENLNPIERALAFKELLNKNIFKNQTEMANELGITRTVLVKSIRLLERLSDDAVEAYFTHVDFVTEGHLHAVMRAPHAEQKAIIGNIKTKTWTVQQLRDYITLTYFPTQRSNNIHLKEKRDNWFDLDIQVRPNMSKLDIQEVLKTLKNTITKLNKLAKEKETK